MGNKIKQIRKALGKKQKEFAGSLGISESALSMIESDKVSVSNQIKVALEAVHHVNLEWLETGQGPMFKENTGLERFSPAQRILIERFTRYFSEKVPIPETERVITVVNSLIKIFMSDNEAAKKALASSIAAFDPPLQDKEKAAKETDKSDPKQNPRSRTKKTKTA